MAVAATQSASQHIRSSLGFNILPKDTSTCRPGESNQHPSNDKSLYPWAKNTPSYSIMGAWMEICFKTSETAPMEELTGSTMCHQTTNSTLDDLRDDGSSVAQIIKSIKKITNRSESQWQVQLPLHSTEVYHDLDDWESSRQTQIVGETFPNLSPLCHVQMSEQKHLVLHVLTSQLLLPACICLFQLAPFLSATHSVTYACVAAPKLPAFPNTACF